MYVLVFLKSSMLDLIKKILDAGNADSPFLDFLELKTIQAFLSLKNSRAGRGSRQLFINTVSQSVVGKKLEAGRERMRGAKQL